MIDQTQIGRAFGPYTYRVTRAQIARFAAAIGLPEAYYRDPAAAAAAGLPDLPAPPTLATAYGLWANPALLDELAAIGAPLPRLLHGEQHYTYHAPFYAGDTLTSEPRISALEERAGRSGRFEILTLTTTLTNQHGALVLTDRLVVVVRGTKGAG